MNLVILILLILLLAGSVPNWHGYGYGPPSLVGVLLVVVIVLLLTGRL